MDQRGGLSGEEDAAAVHFVREHTDERSQQQAREQTEGAGEREVERGVGQSVDEPTECDLLHPMTGHRAGLRGKEAAEIGVFQGAEHVAKEEGARGRERAPAELRRRSTGLFPPLFRVL